MGQIWPIFIYFRSFLNTMTNIAKELTINGIRVDGVLGIRTRDRKMVGADESTGLCRSPAFLFLSDAPL